MVFLILDPNMAYAVSSPTKPCPHLFRRRRPLLLTQHYPHHKRPSLAKFDCQCHDCETRTCLTQSSGRALLQSSHSTTSLLRYARRLKLSPFMHLWLGRWQLYNSAPPLPSWLRFGLDLRCLVWSDPWTNMNSAVPP